jgi:hypothetical protein
MTSPLLPHARALLAAATPGRNAKRGCPDLDPNWPGPDGRPRGPVSCVTYPNCTCGNVDRAHGRKALIAAAPTLLSDLCTALEASEAEAGRLREALATTKHGCRGEPHTCDQELVAAAEGRTDRVIIERNTAIAERDKLREAAKAADDSADEWKRRAERAEADRDIMARHRTAQCDRANVALDECMKLEAERDKLRALLVEALDIADMLASLMPPLYRKEFYRREGIRLATIRTEALK